MIQPATISDYAALARLWARSVKATHGFLKAADFAYYRERIERDYFPRVRLWKYSEAGDIRGFVGVGDMIEMLFVAPKYFGRGIGSSLLDFAVRHCAVTRVDVNEQNVDALRFYLSRGFKVIGRSPCDAEGLPYPILHLSL